MIATSTVAGAWPAATKTTAAWLGFVPRAMVWRVVCGYGLLAHARIHSSRRQQLGWPELAGTELAAVAGVRTSAETALRSTGEQSKTLCSLLGSPGAR